MNHGLYMARAIDLGRRALEQKELPVAAVLVAGEEIIGEAWNKVAGDHQLLAHAEFRLLTEASESLCRLRRRERQQLTVYVTLEPCIMCFGMIMCLNLGALVYALESPGDGVTSVVEQWQRKSEQLPFYRAPRTTGGVMREEAAALFREFASTYRTSPFAKWARQLSDIAPSS